MFTNEAINIPISPINKKDPQPVKSFLVVYPYKLIAPKVPAVIKNTLAILAPVYMTNIDANDAPISAAKIQNTV